MGDFYEMFYEDALTARARARADADLARRRTPAAARIPMCGVPFHAADGYIARLVRKGFRVAICEQVEDPKKAKGLVRREVVRVVSPGTLTDARLSRGARAGVPDGDRAPGAAGRPRRFGASRCSICRPASSRPPSIAGADGRQALADELAVLRPREILAPAGFDGAAALLGDRASAARRDRRVEAWTFEPEPARARRCSISCRRTASTASASRARRPRCGRRRARRTTCATRRRPTSRTSATITLPHRRRLPDHRPDHAASTSRSSSGSEGGRSRIAAARDRSDGHADGRPAAARTGCCGRSSRSSASSDRLDAVEEFAFRSTERGKLRDTLQARARPRAAGRRAPRSARRPARSGRAAAVARRVPRVRLLLDGAAGAARRSLVAELDDLADVRDAHRAHARSTSRRRSRATAASFATASIPSSTSCATISRAGRQVDRRDGGARARAHRHLARSRSASTASSATTSRSRSRTSHACRPTTSASRRSPAASASSRRRSRSTRRRSSAPTSGSSSASSSSSRRCARASPPRRRASRTPRAALAALDVLAALAETAAVAQLHQAARCTTATSSSPPTRAIPVVERHVAGAFVPNDIDLDGADAAARRS